MPCLRFTILAAALRDGHVSVVAGDPRPESETDRYVSDPGQACSYMTAELNISNRDRGQ